GPGGVADPGAIALGAGTVLLVLMTVGWGLSALLTYARFAGFTLEGVASADGGVLRRRYGLLTTREGSLPRRRVQVLRLEESALRRIVGRVVLRAETAGSAAGKGGARAGRDVLAPATTRDAAAALVPVILPGASLPERWTPVSSLIVRRSAFRGGLLALLLAAAAWTLAVPWPLMLALPSLPALGALSGALAHRRLGWAVVGEHLALRSGRLGQARALVPRERVQAVRLSSTPFDRRAGVQTLRLHVVGGAQLAMGYLPAPDAAALARFLTHRADAPGTEMR
ncbi:MAG: PH domain-containing protein, partial [Myxococcota bacterium]